MDDLPNEVTELDVSDAPGIAVAISIEWSSRDHLGMPATEPTVTFDMGIGGGVQLTLENGAVLVAGASEWGSIDYYAPPEGQAAELARLRAENERLRADAAPCVPKMTDAEMVRTESWQSITDELAHAAYLRGIEEGKRQGLAPQDRSAPARHEDMATFAAELKADPAKARKFFQEAGILNEIGALTPEYGGPQEFDYSVINEIGARTVQRAKRLQEISDLLSDQKSLPPELAAKMAERWHELYDSEIAPTAPPAR